MAPETWIVLSMAAGFLLLGIAVSPLAWVALSYLRTRADRETDQCFLEMDERVRTLRDRLQALETALAAQERPPGRGRGGRPEECLPRGPHWLARRPPPPRVQDADSTISDPEFKTSGPRFKMSDSGFKVQDSEFSSSRSIEKQDARLGHLGPADGDRGAAEGPRLIRVPKLDAAPDDRRAALDGLAERHAAIWNLRDAGASADTIARATGQPIGQIELILGLRRQIDGVRTARPHGGRPHE